MRTFLAVALALLTLVCGCKRKSPPPAIAQFDWVLDPGAPGPDRPPAGRSLFDSLVPSPAPFPFAKLLGAIEARIGTPVRSDRVLIPLGRSLQRSAAAPEFFKYPRVVVAFDAEPASGMLVKDRLFLGYHEKAGVIEVISYNQEAGRFEFQIVRDYRDGALPKVLYARRKVCTVCHQNQSPLFSTQLWDETNANPAVSRLLAAEDREFYGIPNAQSADTPYRIDQAVHRANYFSTYQRLWALASPRVRAALVQAALDCRLRGSCMPGDALEPLAQTWRKQWPRGLAIPNPEIPNRNPLAILSREGPREYMATLGFLAQRQMSIDRPFEPANSRKPLEFWQAGPLRLEQLVRGMADAFPERDMAILRRVSGVSGLAAVAEPVFRPVAILRELIGSGQCCVATPAARSDIALESAAR